MTWGPWASNISDAERRARLRAMRALALCHCRYSTNFINTLQWAEVDNTALPAAFTELGKLPALRRRHLLATYALLLGGTNEHNGH
jgi:hypothetical protein